MKSFVPHRCGLSFMNWRIGLYLLRDGTIASSKERTGGVVYPLRNVLCNVSTIGRTFHALSVDRLLEKCRFLMIRSNRSLFIKRPNVPAGIAPIEVVAQ
ncbi:hypothetical protein PHMEG_00032093 [Phytophthora megakarya]|uniref:Uncharacterized protein n=1 Tax=Phytophthora megakarya TaxID=4795 RepID=A0A225UWA6_9STRA|nr:hypothetical protein PHMEG_00032093 [Phytophthora megakarya]